MLKGRSFMYEDFVMGGITTSVDEKLKMHDLD